jgi:hypothetical protein
MSFFNRAAIASLAVLSVPVMSSASVLVGFNLTGDGIVNPYPDPNNPGHNLGTAELPIAATTSDPGVNADPLDTSSNFASYNGDPLAVGYGTAVQVPAYVGPDAVATDAGTNSGVYIDFAVTPTPGNTMSIRPPAVGPGHSPVSTFPAFRLCRTYPRRKRRLFISTSRPARTMIAASIRRAAATATRWTSPER